MHYVVIRVEDTDEAESVVTMLLGTVLNETYRQVRNENKYYIINNMVEDINQITLLAAPEDEQLD